MSFFIIMNKLGIMIMIHNLQIVNQETTLKKLIGGTRMGRIPSRYVSHCSSCL